MRSSSSIKAALFLLAVGCVPGPVQAASTYTCTTFNEDGETSFPHVYPTGINNQGHVAGSFSSGDPFGAGTFFVDSSGTSLPFTIPPFATAGNYQISGVNNKGQVVGTALDNAISPALYRGFISNPDGSVVVIQPPANTPDQQYSDLFVFSINDQGDTSGFVSTSAASALSSGYWFIRDATGFFKLFGTSANLPRWPDSINPQYQPKLNNSGAALVPNPGATILRLPDGSERPLEYKIGRRYSQTGFVDSPGVVYGMNNTGLFVGSANAPFVMDANGNAPAVVCPQYSNSLSFAKAYAINDDGVVTGNLLFSGSVFVATPTGIHSGLKLSNTSWGFSPNPVGVQGGSGTIYVTSTGAADLTFVAISIGARDGNDTPADFAITGNTCMAGSDAARTLAPNQFCAISFTFTPAGPGARTAQLQIEDDAPDSPHIIRLDGTGLGKGRLQFSNDYWQFNPQPVAQVSGPGTVYIYNPGTETINFSSIAISGAQAGDFAIGSNSCGAAVAPYTTCSVAFQFTAQGPGLRSAALVFSDDSGSGRQVVALSGTGL